jgi:gliding motility-associated-like protein
VASLIVDNGHCQDTATIEITVHPPILNTYETIDLLCNGDSTGVIDVSIISGTAPFGFRWSNDAATEDIDQLYAGRYILTITDSNGCMLESEMEIKEPLPLLATEIASQVVSCFGGDDGSLEIMVMGGTTDYSLLWSTGSTTTAISEVSAGIYSLSITDGNGCIGIQDFEIRENAPIEPLDNTMHISCFGKDDGAIRFDNILGGAPPFQVSVQGPNGYNNIGRTSNNLVPGFYLIDITDAEGCQTGMEIQIVEPDSIFIDIIPEDTLLLLGQTLNLTTSYNAQEPVFEWLPERWLDCSDCDNPLASPQGDVVYQVFMTDAYGCQESDQIRIEVTPVRKVFIPNAFTPDGDGHNDVFNVRSGDPGVEKVMEFLVLDRWGAVMFQATDFKIDDPGTGWNGLVREKHDAPAGVYTWVARVLFKDDHRETYKGDVLLIR